MLSLRPAVAGRLLQNLREFGASRVLDHLLPALVHLALVLMYTCSSLCSRRAPALHPRPRPLAGVRGPLHTFLLPQAQHRDATAS
jgi:hypothetical protein